LLLAGGVICTSVASAKDFRPSDLRLCGVERCVTITDRAVLNSMGTFIYGNGRPPIARAPRLGAPVLQLRFRNGYVAGLLGSARLDRFRSHGVICGRFRRGNWYLLPPALAHDLRRLAGTRLQPLGLTGRVPRSC
jgi:hypothetical protein